MLRLYGLLNAHQRERATGSGLARDEMSPDQQKAFDSLASSGVLEPTLSGAPAPLGRAAHRMRFEPLEDVCKRVTFEITSRGVANAVGVFRIGARTSR